MRRSAAPSVIAKKREEREERGKENDAKPKSNFLSGKGSIGRRKFKSPVASSIGSHGSDGPAQRTESSVGNDAPPVGRNASQVLKLMKEVEGSKDNPVVEKSERKSDQLVNINRKRSSLSGSSSSPGVKRRCSEDGRLENEDIGKQGEPLVDEKLECAEEAPAISIANGEPGFKDLNVPQSGTNRDVTGESSCSRDEEGELENSHVDTTMSKNDQGESLRDTEDVPAFLEETLVAGEVDKKHLNDSHRPDNDGRLESTSSEVMGEQHSHVTGEYANGVVKPTKTGALLHGSKRQRPLLHDIGVKVASKPCQEVVVTQHYSVMFCPWKPNTKRKGPWIDGVLVCQGRSCTLQDLDGKAISKAVVQGLKDMPEGATVQVGKYEVEVMRKASSQEVLSGAVYLADKAPPSISTEPPALKPKKSTGFKSFKLQQARTP